MNDDAPVRRHVAVLLAAGGSARLGEPKQLLRTNGETFVHRAARLALETSPERLIVVVGAEAERTTEALAGLACTIVVNPDWRQGLASSLRAVATTIAGDQVSVLVLGCDQPALDAGHLDALLRASAESPAGVAASRYADVVGTPAVVPSLWFASFATEADRGFAHRLRHSEGIACVDAPSLALDVDTPDDLERARALGLIDRP